MIDPLNINAGSISANNSSRFTVTTVTPSTSSTTASIKEESIECVPVPSSCTRRGSAQQQLNLLLTKDSISSLPAGSGSISGAGAGSGFAPNISSPLACVSKEGNFRRNNESNATLNNFSDHVMMSSSEICATPVVSGFQALLGSHFEHGNNENGSSTIVSGMTKSHNGFGSGSGYNSASVASGPEESMHTTLFGAGLVADSPVPGSPTGGIPCDDDGLPLSPMSPVSDSVDVIDVDNDQNSMSILVLVNNKLEVA
ncbi:unnamed protein product [Ambrosiozyma monospora]|uniref:Unnamed protein product n=1 Tax=Ambrosiozyma monospora TaxID=43982 RepID=A0ACB5U9X9_AMBMO|nr:unnamed protein product [Ambrosiozyma monospora]